MCLTNKTYNFDPGLVLVTCLIISIRMAIKRFKSYGPRNNDDWFNWLSSVRDSKNRKRVVEGCVYTACNVLKDITVLFVYAQARRGVEDAKGISW